MNPNWKIDTELINYINYKMNSEGSSHEMDKIYTNNKGHSLWLGNVRAA